MTFFQEKIMALAVEVNESERAREEVARSKNSGLDSKGGSGKPSSSKSGVIKPTNDADKGGDKKSERPNGPSVGDRKRKWKGKCLNPKCNGIHRVRDCKDTSERRLLDYSKSIVRREPVPRSSLGYLRKRIQMQKKVATAFFLKIRWKQWFLATTDLILTLFLRASSKR